MSTLYLASDLRNLADRLADALDAGAKASDFFTPVRVVVPNRFVRKWLRLHLARKLDVAINLTYQSLEEALWELLQQVDPNPSPVLPEAIDANTYRLMVLSVLLEERDPNLAPLQRYLQRHGPGLTRLSCRRAWYLADRLGALLQEYEYHRQDALIQPWLRNEAGTVNDSLQLMERAQRALFRHITREPDGKRALLVVRGEQLCKTFPQYAMELMENFPTSPQRQQGFVDPLLALRASREIIHFFGFTQLSELHARTIGWLGRFFDLRVYHLNAFTSFTQPESNDNGGPAAQLLREWGGAGRASLHILAQHFTSFQIETLPTNQRPAVNSRSVLARLQDQLHAAACRLSAKPQAAMAQDASLQIVGCPGVVREVETVYNSIVHNLNSNPALRQTDIAVLVTDLPRYRAALQGVFERAPAPIRYNLVDFNAAGASTFGQALLGMLDLALESFSRTRVFAVILNPCFLARLGVDRAQAMTWLEWAEQLGIYQGWDANEKQQQGYPASPLYAWQLGLRRLRLGRYMAVVGEDADAAAPRFGDVIPFADLASTEREHLDAFCRAIEGLLPSLARLRTWQASGARWAAEIERLLHVFLEVPPDRPEEAQVRDELLLNITRLERWDFLREAARKEVGLPLALVREYVHGQLEALPGNRGEYLIGGVTISTLQPRPVPFAIIYILGLGDDLFPGSNALSSFDLRAEQLPGDIRPAQGRLYDFLTTILAAQQKLYLLYNNHDLDKDQELLPAVALQQLQRYVSDHVQNTPFQAVSAPAQRDDPALLEAAEKSPHQDVLVQYRDADRCLALTALRSENRLKLTPAQAAEWVARWPTFQRTFEVAPDESAARDASTTVALRELRRFLELPAQASLRRHLRVETEYDDAIDDDEPLVTPTFAANSLIRQTIERLIRSAATGDVQEALATWQDQFSATYADARLRCQVPEAAFGAIDQAAILSDLQERIHGQGQLDAFLREHAGMTFCGPVLIGESSTPIGARLRFPALRLRPGHELPADAPQEIRLVGWTGFAWHAAERFEILVLVNGKKPDGRQIAAALFEPALFHLMLLANAAASVDGTTVQHWIGQRDVALHCAGSDGMLTWTYPRGSISPAEATQYLAALARDLLDPTCFDLLPFKIMQDKKLLPVALADGSALSADDFRVTLEGAIDDAREEAFQMPAVPLLVEMIHASVPADALAKVQRRFRLLERGPASLRQAPLVRKARKGAKP